MTFAERAHITLVLRGALRAFITLHLSGQLGLGKAGSFADPAGYCARPPLVGSRVETDHATWWGLFGGFGGLRFRRDRTSQQLKLWPAYASDEPRGREHAAVSTGFCTDRMRILARIPRPSYRADASSSKTLSSDCTPVRNAVKQRWHDYSDLLFLGQT